jgi:hypothetical protein
MLPRPVRSPQASLAGGRCLDVEASRLHVTELAVLVRTEHLESASLFYGGRKGVGLPRSGGLGNATSRCHYPDGLHGPYAHAFGQLGAGEGSYPPASTVAMLIAVPRPRNDSIQGLR